MAGQRCAQGVSTVTLRVHIQELRIDRAMLDGTTVNCLRHQVDRAIADSLGSCCFPDADRCLGTLRAPLSPASSLSDLGSRIGDAVAQALKQ